MSKSSRLDKDSKHAIEDAIRWAPSADNSQPWVYRWRDDALDLSINLSHAGGISDARFLLSDLALGAATEAAVLSGYERGYASRVQWLPKPASCSKWVSTIAFEQATHVQEQNRRLASVLRSRCTCRVGALRGPITADAWNSLDLSIRPLEVDLIQLNGADRRHAIKALGLAETMRFADQRYHAELMSSIRFDKGLQDQVTEGIAPGSLGLHRAEWPLFKLVRHWRFVRGLNVLGGARLLALRSAVIPAIRAPGFCLLTVPNRDRISILSGGRGLLRMWLAATLQGLAVQPYAAPTVFSMAFAPQADIALRQRERLIRLIDDLMPGQNHALLMMLRLGYPPHTKPNTQRYSLRRK